MGPRPIHVTGASQFLRPALMLPIQTPISSLPIPLTGPLYNWLDIQTHCWSHRHLPGPLFPKLILQIPEHPPYLVYCHLNHAQLAIHRARMLTFCVMYCLILSIFLSIMMFDVILTIFLLIVICKIMWNAPMINFNTLFWKLWEQISVASWFF